MTRYMLVLRLLCVALFVLCASHAAANITDDFDRPDSLSLNNGWLEKAPDMFDIEGGEVAKRAVNVGYLDSLVYRPPTEDVLDVEASVELRIFNAAQPGYPQLHTRVQSDTAAIGNWLDSYILFIDDNPSRAVLGRQRGSTFAASLSAITIYPALNTTDRYRLRLRTTGTDPVLVEGFVERYTGTAWELVGQSTVNDSDAQRIDTEGSVGFGGYFYDGFNYDTFVRTNLVPGANPTPILSSLDPDIMDAGSPAFTLSVSGANFVADSLVRWNGIDLATTFIDADELQADVDAGQLASPGTATVTTFNPEPGGGVSNPLVFVIQAAGGGANPVPTTTGLSPDSAFAGSSTLTLSVFGTDFVDGATVRWNGSDLATTFIDAGELQADVDAGRLASPGTVTVTAFNPAPGGGTSNPQTFMIGPPPGGSTFADDFNRPDSLTLDNGWLEKTPDMFDIEGSEVAKRAVSVSYRDSLVYRPMSEDLLDVEASVELRFTNTAQPGYPQLHTRVQSDTVAIGDWLDSYFLYIDGDPSRAILGRQRGSAFVASLSVITISPALNTTDRYRMRLRTTGTSPVLVEGLIERFNGVSWEVIGQAAENDNSADLIDMAGSVGVGGYVYAAFIYDNFQRTDLSAGGNPIPILSTLGPNNVDAGSPGFTLTVDGADFTAESVVRWDGVDRSTTFVSSTELQVAISSADIAVPATPTVTVFTPAPGGGVSGGLTFTVNDPNPPVNPVPATSQLNPAVIDEGSGSFTLTVNGSEFVPGSVVRWNGAERATTFVSANQLSSIIIAADVDVPEIVSVTVFNPAPGGGESNPQTFVVQAVGGGTNPVPTTAGLSPDSTFAGSSALTLSVFGTDFVDGATVRWNGIDLATTFIDAGELQADVDAGQLTSPGTATVTAFNPAPGGGLSNGQTFVIDALPPVTGVIIGGLTPGSVDRDAGDFMLTVDGSNFCPESVVRWNNQDRPTTFVSANQLLADISAADLVGVDIATITIYSATTGCGDSNPYSFFVLDTGESFFFDDFERPDSSALGNSWTEKLPVAWNLENGRVTSVGTLYVYRDAIAYRSPAEDRRDVEVGVDIERVPGSLYAQLHARVQRDTVAEPDTLQSYLMYVEDGWAPGQAIAFAVQPATPAMGECIIDIWDLPAQMQLGEKYRMRFRVSGDNPVLLEGFVDWFDGTQWQPFGQGSIIHDDNTQPHPFYCPEGFVSSPISTGGTVGFSKWYDVTDDYDNFYWRDLAPAPAIETLQPSSVIAGDPGFTLQVSGTNFTPASEVRWDGTPLTTVFVSNSELQADVLALSITSPASVDVTVFETDVFNESAAVQFTIDPADPAAVITNLQPASAFAGDPAFTLSVTGSNFLPTSVVRWNGQDRPTAYVGPTLLMADITAADIATAGQSLVSVYETGSGISNSATFVINFVEGGFFDGFDRIDSSTLDNGWIEKSGAAFTVIGNQVVKQPSSTSYLDNVVYRPALEDVLDVQISVEFAITGGQIGYPQIFSRLQSATAGQPGVLDGYLLYINNSSSQAIIARHNGSSLTVLSTVTISTALASGGTYRMRLRTEGTTSVLLSAFIEELSSGTWQIIGQATFTDSSGSRHETPGVVGFGGHYESGYAYDNFRYDDLAP